MIDPSVTDESNRTSVDLTLDMYDRRNGYTPDLHDVTYDPAFLERHRAANIVAVRALPISVLMPTRMCKPIAAAIVAKWLDGQPRTPRTRSAARTGEIAALEHRGPGARGRSDASPR
jgi:hypothetical protein